MLLKTGESRIRNGERRSEVNQMKKGIGYSILAFVFGCMFGFTGIAIGFKTAAFIWAVALITTYLISYALKMIE